MHLALLALLTACLPEAASVGDGRPDRPDERDTGVEDDGNSLDLFDDTGAFPPTLDTGDDNTPPEADAGPDQVRYLGDTVYLDGTGSWDEEVFDTGLSYVWTFLDVGESALTNSDIQDRTQAEAMFTPDAATVYTVRLQVYDGIEAAYDEVEIYVEDPDDPGGDGEICEDTCPWAGDGECDDGGPGADYDGCDYGTDCSDCGPRPA